MIELVGITYSEGALSFQGLDHPQLLQVYTAMSYLRARGEYYWETLAPRCSSQVDQRGMDAEAALTR